MALKQEPSRRRRLLRKALDGRLHSAELIADLFCAMKESVRTIQPLAVPESPLKKPAR